MRPRLRGPAALMALTGCQFIEEVRTVPDTVSWGGTVQADRSASTGEVGAFTAGTIEMFGEDGTLLDTAVQPFEDDLDYWRFEAAPVGAEVAIRLAGAEDDTLAAMVWRTAVPSGSALWFTGALFTREHDVLNVYLDAVEALDGAEPISRPEDGALAMVWGEPSTPEEWAGVDIEVTDGDGQAAVVWRLALNARGNLVEAEEGAAVDLFIAPNLAPGTVTMTAGGATTRWPAQGGDVLSAVFYDLEVE